jgi:hypothetical protein
MAGLIARWPRWPINALGCGSRFARKHVDEWFLNTTEPVLPEVRRAQIDDFTPLRATADGYRHVHSPPFKVQAELVSSLP